MITAADVADITGVVLPLVITPGASFALTVAGAVEGSRWIGARIARRGATSFHLCDRHFPNADIHIRICLSLGSGVIGDNDIRYFSIRHHGHALSHTPDDVLHILHETVESRPAKRNLAAAAIQNSCRWQRN